MHLSRTTTQASKQQTLYIFHYLISYFFLPPFSTSYVTIFSIFFETYYKNGFNLQLPWGMRERYNCPESECLE